MTYYNTFDLVNCRDSISKYVLRKKMCVVNMWSISQQSVFQPLYNRLIKDMLLRITNRSTHKIFCTAGQLYLEFLKGKSCEKQRLYPMSQLLEKAQLKFKTSEIGERKRSGSKAENGTRMTSDHVMGETA